MTSNVVHLAERRARGVRRRRDYGFVDDKHEIIYIMMRLVDLEAATSGRSESAVIAAACREAGISATAPRGWFYGSTRRPFIDTAERFLRALGVDLIAPRLRKHMYAGRLGMRRRARGARA